MVKTVIPPKVVTSDVCFVISLELTFMTVSSALLLSKRRAILEGRVQIDGGNSLNNETTTSYRVFLDHWTELERAFRLKMSTPVYNFVEFKYNLNEMNKL